MEVVGRHIYGQPSAESSGGSMATAGDTPTKVQVTKAAPMLRQNQKRERAAAVFFPCRLVQNVQVHVLLGHQLVVWLIVRGEPTNQPNCRDRQGGSQSDLSNQLHIGRLVEKQY